MFNLCKKKSEEKIIIENKRKDWVEIKHQKFNIRIENDEVWLEYLGTGNSIYFRRISMKPCDLKDLYLILEELFEKKAEAGNGI